MDLVEVDLESEQIEIERAAQNGPDAIVNNKVNA